MIRVVPYLLFICLLLSCLREKTQVVPAEFQEYVDAFFIEGNQRGLNMDLLDIDLIIEYGTLSGTTAGQCRFRDNRITIDKSKWETNTKEQKYWIIFHELGHCVLDRDHRNDKVKNGECVSIMKGIENEFDCSLNLYSENWWNYYLDELFDPNTAQPIWYNLYENYNDASFSALLLAIDTHAVYFELDSATFDLPNNFNIDFEFKSWNTDEELVKFYFGNIGFAHCDRCSGVNARISSNSTHNDYYANPDGDIQFDTHIKLTIRKISDDLIFYVNERYIHTFESDLWSGINTISTNHFYEAMQMKVTINVLD